MPRKCRLSLLTLRNGMKLDLRLPITMPTPASPHPQPTPVPHGLLSHAFVSDSIPGVEKLRDAHDWVTLLLPLADIPIRSRTATRATTFTRPRGEAGSESRSSTRWRMPQKRRLSNLMMTYDMKLDSQWPIHAPPDTRWCLHHTSGYRCRPLVLPRLRYRRYSPSREAAGCLRFGNPLLPLVDISRCRPQ
ncbi:hypothetical protein CALVIDRAFT_243162 [Calocera viscosa TUFC12733]|uniref:Uncharacterized protein n=1 Tax=Calocera viscosa (strain TUFC12733) TaxID=1330018 RepID=A0A167JQ64_CALVF|nr:hypothetical protein CALVIDRAFT_243162 [Calocera viscosa TUFC12733]